MTLSAINNTIRKFSAQALLADEEIKERYCSV